MVHLAPHVHNELLCDISSAWHTCIQIVARGYHVCDILIVLVCSNSHIKRPGIQSLPLTAWIHSSNFGGTNEVH